LDAVCVTDVTACSGVTITVRESSVVDGFFRSRPEEPWIGDDWLWCLVETPCTRRVCGRGVRNPMKMSDIDFLNRYPISKVTSEFENQERSFRSSILKSRLRFGTFRTVFHVFSFTVHLLDVLNSQSIFLYVVSLHFYVLALSHFGWHLVEPIQ